MADISAAMKDWSATSGSNNPSGSVNVGTGLDDNLREIQGSVVRNLHHKGADIASATTTDLGAVEGLFHDITGTTTITGFGTVRAGVWKVIKFEGALTLTHNATSLILPGGANITTADGDIAIVVSEGSGNWRCVSFLKKDVTPGDGTFRSVQVFTTTGANTWTKPAGLRRVRVTTTGGGGSGSGSGNAGNRGGSGGGSGGTSIKTIAAASLGSTETATVGTGGSAPLAGAAGNNGGTSSFGAHCSGAGGVGGNFGASYGGSGGAGSSGDINVTGGDGDAGNTTLGMGGAGGASFWGGGGSGGSGDQAGSVGKAYGSGGGGGGTSDASGDVGGAGKDGIIVVEEFF